LKKRVEVLEAKCSLVDSLLTRMIQAKVSIGKAEVSIGLLRDRFVTYPPRHFD